MAQGYPSSAVFDALPIGALAGWATGVAPSGWLICDGSAVSRTTYADLFAVLGTTWGAGNGTTTFNLPDLRGRALIGSDAGGVNLPVNHPALAATGGEEQHTLLTAELASHNHTSTDSEGLGTASTIMNSGNFSASGFNRPSVSSAGNRWPIGFMASAGSGTAHNNLQPYLAINWIVKYASGFVGVTTQTPGNQSLRNYLVNGGMDLAQRQTPATYTTPTQTTSPPAAATTSVDGYSLDQWKCSFQTATLKAQRVDTNGALESGITAGYYGQWQQQTGAGKFMVYQPLEGRTTMALAGQTVTFQAKVKSSSAKTIRMAVIQLTSAGTIDTIPNPLVTSWNSNTVDPTLGSNLSVIASATSQSTTTAWANFSVTVTLPTNAKNIIVAFWTDSQFSINDTLAITEAGLYLSTTTVTPWQPPTRDEIVTACERHYSKTYDTDTAPGTATANGLQRAVAAFTGTTNCQLTYDTKTTMRSTAPAVTVWNYSSGATGSARNITGASDVTVGAPVDTCSKSTTVYSNTSVTAGQYVGYQITLDAGL